jgi:hypothetical protein
MDEPDVGICWKVAVGRYSCGTGVDKDSVIASRNLLREFPGFSRLVPRAWRSTGGWRFLE